MSRLVLVSVVSAALLLPLTAPALGDTENQCIACHQAEDFYSRQPKLYRYYQEWKLSPHAQNGVSCDDCHGGNPQASSHAEAHKGIYPNSDPKSSLHFTRQPETCGNCHPDKQREFAQSKHFGALMSGRQPAPTCTTCHPAMNKRPTYRLIVLNACTTCHGPENSRDLPQIADDAEDLLRHLNMAEGLLGWARLHFAEKGWPEESKPRLDDLDHRFQKLVSQVHRFNLETSQSDTILLLTELRAVFEAERQSVDAERQTP